MFKKKEIKKEATTVEKLKEYINKYDYNMKDILFSASLELSDIIWEEHRTGCYIIDAVIIGIQMLLVVIGVICSLFGLRISAITCSITIILLSLVLVNNAIHDMAWRKAKKRLNDLAEVVKEAQEKVDNNSTNGDII